MESVLGLLVLAIVGAFAWAAWPVSAALGIVLLLWWGLAALQGYLAKLRGYHWRLQLLQVANGTLLTATKYCAAGLGFVALAQIVLLVGRELVDYASVQQWEIRLSAWAMSLSEMFAFKSLVIGLVVVVLLTLLFPRVPWVTRYLTVKNALGKIGIVLATVTSFTFFSHVSLSLYDAELRWSERWRARAALQEIDQARREIAAATWTEDRLSDLETETQNDLNALFRQAHKTSFANYIVKETARTVGRGAPRLAVAASVTEVESRDTRRIREFLQKDKLAPDAPSLRELRSFPDRVRPLQTRLAEARKAVLEIATEAITQIVPQADRRLTQVFVSEVMDSVTKHALDKVVPSSVDDFRSARGWLAKNGLLSTGLASSAESTGRWVWNLRGVEGVPRLAASEVAMGVLAAKLASARESQLAAQKQWQKQWEAYRPPRGSTYRPKPVRIAPRR